ncbi:MAG: septation protein SpoVG family protein [Candidatus Omnitrophota bacterium]
MEITEVKVFMKESPDKKLKAYATITIDSAFVVRNVKVIEGNKGLFVAMPSRKVKEPCPKCGFRNASRSKFCNQCGGDLPMRELKREPRFGQGNIKDDAARQSEHRDIAHPITAECREYIQRRILDAYDAENGRPQKSAQAPYPAREEALEPAPVAESSPVVELAPRIEEANDIEL